MSSEEKKLYKKFNAVEYNFLNDFINFSSDKMNVENYKG